MYEPVERGGTTPPCIVATFCLPVKRYRATTVAVPRKPPMPAITFVRTEPGVPEFVEVDWPVVPRVGERVGLQHPPAGYRTWEVTEVLYLENLVERSCPEVYYVQAPGCRVRVSVAPWPRAATLTTEEGWKNEIVDAPPPKKWWRPEGEADLRAAFDAWCRSVDENARRDAKIRETTAEATKKLKCPTTGLFCGYDCPRGVCAVEGLIVPENVSGTEIHEDFPKGAVYRDTEDPDQHTYRVEETGIDKCGQVAFEALDEPGYKVCLTYRPGRFERVA